MTEGSKNTFLFFGRIIDYKGLDILLDSLKYVRDDFPDFKLIIAGPGSLREYEEKIQLFSNNIDIYNKNIEPEEAYKYFEISEFVVLPYKDATGSGVIPVAFCFKKATLVTNVGELSSVVSNNETGYIIPPNSPRILAETIIKMLKNKRKTETMGKKGYNFSLKELSWKPIVKNIYPSDSNISHLH